MLLVTNDDGVHAPGIRALSKALATIGEVHIVAPEREVSACGHSLSLRHPLRTTLLEPRVHSVDGTPADCVGMALSILPRRPDLVLSGINLGANLADDIFYSGTIGGAREATFFGLPAIAVSLAARTPEFGAAADFAAKLARIVLDQGLPARTLVNVNVPPGTPSRAVFTSQGRHERALPIQPALAASPSITSQWAGDDSQQRLRDEMSDVHAVRAGMISITPLHTDTTHHRTLKQFRSWTV